MDQPTQPSPTMDAEMALAFVRAWAEALPTARERVRRAIAEEPARIRAAYPTLCALFDHRPTQPYGPASGRVPTGEMRRPDLPGMRQPGEELGEEVHGEVPG